MGTDAAITSATWHPVVVCHMSHLPASYLPLTCVLLADSTDNQTHVVNLKTKQDVPHSQEEPSLWFL